MKKVFLSRLNKSVVLVSRDRMKAPAMHRAFRKPHSIPATTLPIDCTGNASVSCPMDGNDTYGDCGEAMAAHVDNILTFRQGKGTESVFSESALVDQYLNVSGGDNGLDEDEVVNQIWKVGIAGNDQAVIVDSLDIDVTNIPLAQFAIDQFYAIEMAWSVPDDFLNNFAEGTVWSTADNPDPANGHFVPLSDIGGPSDVADGTNLNGFYRLWTWGTWCWVSPDFVASVQPECFIVFSPRQFDPTTGYDSHGRHITTQAAMWVACGGNPIPTAVINSFPGVNPNPTPTPTPGPTPTPTPVPTVPTLSGSLTLNGSSSSILGNKPMSLSGKVSLTGGVNGTYTGNVTLNGYTTGPLGGSQDASVSGTLNLSPNSTKSK
jgi:hypothetical protein